MAYEEIAISVKDYPEIVEMDWPLPETVEEIPIKIDLTTHEIETEVKSYPDIISVTMPLLNHPHIIQAKLPDTYVYFLTKSGEVIYTSDSKKLQVII